MDDVLYEALEVCGEDSRDGRLLCPACSTPVELGVLRYNSGVPVWAPPHPAAMPHYNADDGYQESNVVYVYCSQCEWAVGKPHG